MKVCRACGAEQTRSQRGLCLPCHEAHTASRTAAHIAVRRERMAGRLPNPATLVCVDCGAPATCYEHRDYLKPIDVDAVCWSCNSKRGPAYFNAIKKAA